MYPLEVFSNNKRALAALQKGIIDWVKFKYNQELKPKSAEEVSEAQALEVHPMFIMRFVAMKCGAAYPMGFANAEQHTKFFKWAASAAKTADELAIMQKDAEKELSKVLLNVIEPELTDRQVKVDAGSMLCVPQKSLAGWASVNAQKFVKLFFMAGDMEICFVLPLFDKKFYEAKTLDSFGFEAGARVMVVDDSATSRKLSRFALNLAGYITIDECEDGDAAFKKLAQSSPVFDLVVADWHMPNLSGFELLKKVRRDNEMKNLPMILVTGEQNAAEVTEAIKERVNGYVVKPFLPETLYKAMKKAGALSVTQKKAA